MNQTKIEWTDFTWNPITGCTKKCDYCYARRMAENPFYARAFPYVFTPHFYPERLNELGRKIIIGKRVFVCSMSELFGDYQEWTQQVLYAIKEYPQTTFQLLTKRAENLISFSPFPDNAWVGVSVTSQETYNNVIYFLSRIQAKVKFISFEPLQSPVHVAWGTNSLANIQWVIVGQCTPISAKTQPKIEWIQEIIEAADKHSIPVFMKNNLQSLYPGQKLRQEMPNG